MSDLVLDASALLAMLHAEPGSARVIAALPAAMSAVNLSEVVAKLAERDVPEAEIRESLADLELEVHPFSAALAYAAGLLRPQTKPLGLSLGDRACLSLGQHLGRAVLTADRLWRELDLGIEIQLVR